MSLETVSLEHQLQLYKGLVEVSALINGITNSSELLPAILDVAIRVFNAETASLFLLNGSGELEMAAARGGVAAKPESKIVVPRGKGISGWVLESGEPLLVADAYSDSRFFSQVDQQLGFRTRSLLCVPMRRKEKEIGVLQILNPNDRLAFDEADLEAFTAYGNLAATAIDKLRTIERQREQQQAAQEIAFAREIQRSFLPQTLPEGDDLTFAAAYRPAYNVGGDFYDVMQITPDEFYFVIGDVSGKGVPAALLMAQALSMLRLIIRSGIAPGEALQQWNEMLCGHTIRGMFITALLGRVFISSHRVELVNAGHCWPMVSRSAGSPEEIVLKGAPPLGILPELPRQNYEFTLPSRDWLVLYTDGLVESFDPEEVPLDRAGVKALLESPCKGPTEVIDRLSLGESAHRRTAQPSDDLSMLVFGFR